MRSRNDLWESLGELSEEENVQLLSRLFMTYEQLAEREPDNPAVQLFFEKLNQALDLVTECNLNRR